jgi:hypothetical protein
MATVAGTTYGCLIKPIPPAYNLSNISEHAASKTCEYCSLIVPDQRKMSNNLIKTDYTRIDQYPDFPSLKATAKAGCGFCRLLRKTIRNAWATRPMEEWGVGPIREQEGLWNDILEESWDGKVKIHKAVYSMASPSEDPGENSHTVISLGIEFGPLTTFVPRLGSTQHGDIGRVIGFKTFDSHDKFCIPV